MLKHNGYNESTLEAYCELCIRNSTAYYGAVMLNNVPNWLDTLEAIIGKLKPLPKLEEIVLQVGDLVETSIRNEPIIVSGFDYGYEVVRLKETSGIRFSGINDGKIKSVNGKSGIYKIPEFNFEQYLLDNGFKTEHFFDLHDGLSSSYVSIYKSKILPDNTWCYNGLIFQETPQNADILIAIAKLAKDLK